MLRTLLLGAICLLWASTLMGQSNDYYWASNNRVTLTPSSTHFIVLATLPPLLRALSQKTSNDTKAGLTNPMQSLNRPMR